MEFNKIYNENCLEGLKKIEDKTIDCVITSPPYFGLRCYSTEPQVWGGKEECSHVWVEGKASGNHNFRPGKNGTVGNHRNREIWKGDIKIEECSKCGAYRGEIGLEPQINDFVNHLCDIFDEIQRVLKDQGTCFVNLGDTYSDGKMGLPPRCLGLVPFRFAIEMCSRGWVLRNNIVWQKPNQMPSSVSNRFTRDWESIFFFTKKSKDYYFEKQLEPYAENTSKKNKTKKGRNKREVWSISTVPNPNGHWAMYPEELVEIPLKAGCPEKGVVLDPFMGAGTTALVAKKHGRNFLGYELNKEFIDIAEKRLKETFGNLF
jgi:site-specific DNA-methyltransferase (adenine-specific)